MRSKCLRRLLLVYCLASTGCVSGLMDHYSGKYRTLLKEGVSQEQMRKSIGAPSETVVGDKKGTRLFDSTAVFGLVFWGLVAKQRSPVGGVIAVVVALLAAGGAWYAWAESKSIPWTIGYGVVALASVASAMRQLFGVK